MREVRHRLLSLLSNEAKPERRREVVGPDGVWDTGPTAEMIEAAVAAVRGSDAMKEIPGVAIEPIRAGDWRWPQRLNYADSLAAPDQVESEARVTAERLQFEADALEQAKARQKADASVKAMALARVAVEREAERLLQQRVEAEQLAVAEAHQREHAEMELREAMVARAARENELAAMARQKLEAEEAAIKAATEKSREEAIALEAARVARETVA